MSSVYDDREFANMPVNIEDIKLEATSPTPSTATNSTYASESRLRLLDGTFFQYLPGNSTSTRIVALCMKCFPKTIYVKGYNNCSSNFLSHLKRKHGEGCVEEYKNYMKNVKRRKISGEINNGEVSETSTKVNQQSKTLTQDQFDEDIVEYFIHSMTPLKAVESPYFSKIFMKFNILEMGLNVMSRKMLVQRLEDYYNKEMEDIKYKLGEIDFLCTLVDICSIKGFVGVTVHWITNDFRRLSLALACRKFKGTFTLDRITEMIQEIYDNFNINPDKIIATIAYNGSDYVKPLTTFGVELSSINMVERCEEDDDVPDSSDSDEFEEEEIKDTSTLYDTDVMEDYSQLAQLRSSVHTLTLCATTDANKVLNERNNTTLSIMHNDVMLKCNALWKAAAQPESAEVIQNILHHSLSGPKKSNWNSLFDSIQQIYSIKEKNLKLHRALTLKNPINEMEYDYLHEYLRCAAPVSEALNIMQEENNSYYGIVLPCLLTLRKKLKRIDRKQNFIYCAPLIKKYMESVHRRFSQYYDLITPESLNAAIAALSFPRFKNKWLSCIEPTQRSTVLSLFKLLISKEIRENPESETAEIKNISSEDNFFNFDSDSDSESSITKFSQSPDVRLIKAEQLMLHFFAEEGQELEILNRHAEIKRLFIKYNTVLPSANLVQQLFSSDAVMIHTPKDPKSSDQMFGKRIVLQANLNNKKV